MPPCCSKCQTPDYPVCVGFDSQMKPILGHYLRIDPYLLDRTFVTEEEKHQGFAFKTIDGKPCKWRHICEKCFGEQETTKHYRSTMRQELAKRGDDKDLRHNFFVQQMMLNTD